MDKEDKWININIDGEDNRAIEYNYNSLEDPSSDSCRTSGATNSPNSNCCQERRIPQPYSAFTQVPTANTRGVDERSQPSNLPTISPPTTPMGFELVTLTLIPLVGPQVLPILLKAIDVRKGAYPIFIVHAPKCPRRTQGELMDAANPPIYQQQ